MPDPDPVEARRAFILRYSRLGKRLGYALVLLSIVAFVSGYGSGFSNARVQFISGCLAAASVLLVPSIILGYAAKAAARSERRSGQQLPD